MYRQLDDFLADWQQETAMTIRLFEALNEDVLEQKVYRQGRELGRIVWHIVQTVSEMGHRMGLLEHDSLAQEKMPPFLPAVIACYKGQSNRLMEALRQKWTDADLPAKIPMYGEDWARGTCLRILIGHQAHHRGQISVLMRQAGIKAVGTYGPAKEEWKAMGLPAMD